ncbi:MAG: hypothetical protein LLG05_14410 [Porphyromonadaceae bacterium]|nr:hypothetical protein [Porphyromonadaceae bacterium]
MDITVVYLLLFLSIFLSGISLACAATNRSNVVTMMAMFFSGVIFWALSNEFIGGTVTRVNSVTGASEVIRDVTASNVLMGIGLMLAGFAVQVWQAVSTSGMVNELDN